jgi:hypothetical protein
MEIDSNEYSLKDKSDMKYIDSSEHSHYKSNDRLIEDGVLDAIIPLSNLTRQVPITTPCSLGTDQQASIRIRLGHGIVGIDL